MSVHQATVEWKRQGEFARKAFSRLHRWQFDGGVELPAGASPAIVPLPWTSAAVVDPEEAFVAAVSSCHMMTFLFHAANDGWVVESYRDVAQGHLAAGWIQEIVLRPKIDFGGAGPSPDAIDVLHRRAHEGCFISQSIKSTVRIEPQST